MIIQVWWRGKKNQKKTILHRKSMGTYKRPKLCIYSFCSRTKLCDDQPLVVLEGEFTEVILINIFKNYADIQLTYGLMKESDQRTAKINAQPFNIAS